MTTTDPRDEIPSASASLLSEEQLVGVAMQSPAAFAAARLIVRPEHFGNDWMRSLWEFVVEEYNRLGRFAVSTARERFKADPVYGDKVAGWIVNMIDIGAVALVGRTPVDVGEDLARAVRDFAGRRRLLAIARDVLARADDVELSPDELAADVARQVSDQAVGGTSALTRQQVLEQVIDSIRRPLECYATGLPSLDEAMAGGMFAGYLYGFQARYKTGKTALAGTISLNLQKRGVPHLVLTNEMAPMQFEHRNIGRLLEFNPIAFLKPAREWLVDKIAPMLAEPSFTFYEHLPGGTLDDVRAVVARAQVRHGIKGVIMDYMQRIKGIERGQTEEQHLRKCSDYFADNGARTGLFWAVFAQENKDGSTRGGEGLRLAAHQYYTLHKPKDGNRAWLEGNESRYTPAQDVGSEDEAAFRLNSNGVWFDDLRLPAGSLGLTRAAS